MSSGLTRQTFSEHEKVCLQELIIKYRINSAATIGAGAGNQSAKKMAWARLTQEFNSIETNSKRTEAQLKKCWDNLKTRRKQALAQEKRERMRTGGGSCVASTSQDSQDAIDAALLDATNIELQCVWDSDVDMVVIDQTPLAPVPTAPTPAAPAATTTSGDETSTQIQEPIPIASDGIIHRPSAGCHLSSPAPSQMQEPVEVVETPRRPTAGSRPYGPPAQTIVPKNIRAHVINEEFSLRKENYKVVRDRDEELHKLKITERQWLVKAAEEKFKTACIERESAEELLLCNRANRELAQLNLANAKHS